MIAIDVGNTNITTGIFSGNRLSGVYRASTEKCIMERNFLSEIPYIFEALSDDAVVISSVRPQATEIIIEDILSSTGKQPIVVDVNTMMGIEISYETRETLGIDRLVSATAAWHLYRKKDRPVIVIDMGTATTIDYVSSQGVFMGGMIAPGIFSAYEGLLSAAPVLPRIDQFYMDGIIGTSTSASIRSGVIMGHACMIRKAVELMARSKQAKPVNVLTGGPSRVIRKVLPKYYIVDENLILKGLNIIYSSQRGKRC